MRTLVHLDFGLMKAEKARLTMIDQYLEFEPDPIECRKCERHIDIGHFLRGKLSNAVCPRCQTPFEQSIPFRIYWITKFPAPSWFFMSDEQIALNEISNSHVNVHDPIILTWKNCTTRLEGKVVSIQDQIITGVFRMPKDKTPPDYAPLESGAGPAPVLYKIEFMPTYTVHARQLAALDYLKEETSPKLKKVIFGHLPKWNRESPPPDDASYQFETVKFEATPSQTRAVDRILRSKLALVQGPPGCGKTAVIAASVVQFLRHRKGERILVCGTSNVSVENLVKALLPTVTAAGGKLVWLDRKSVV
jgi:hypothetical protein